MYNGELTRAQRMANFFDLCNEDVEKAAGQILIKSLPSGSHERKLSALPEFTQSAVMFLGGPEIFGTSSVRQLLSLIPASKEGKEINVVAAITKAHNFLSFDKI